MTRNYFFLPIVAVVFYVLFVGYSPVRATVLYQLKFNDQQGNSTLQNDGAVGGDVILDIESVLGNTPEIVFDSDSPDQSPWVCTFPSLGSNGYYGPILFMPDSNMRLQLSQANDEMTLSTWVKWNGSGSGPQVRGLAGKWTGTAGWFWSISTSGQLTFTLRTTSDSTWSRMTEGVLVQGQWTHIAVVIDNDAAYGKTEGGIQFFINGKAAPLSMGMGGMGNVMAAADTPINVGASFGGNAQALNGSLDDFQIHDTALNASQIHLLFETRSLRYHLDFEDPQGNSTLANSGSIPDLAIEDTNTGAGTSSAGEFVANVADGSAWGYRLPLLESNDHYGTALELPDSQSRFELTGSTDAMTIATWVKWEGPGPENRTCGIAGKWDGSGGWFWCIQPDGKLNFNLRTHTGSTWARQSVGTLTVGQWTHVTLVIDNTAPQGITGGGIQFFINGIMTPLTASIGDFGSLFVSAATPVILGANFSTNGHPLNGSIDDLRMYECALNPVDIYTLAGAPNDPLDINDYVYSQNGKQMISLQNAFYMALAQGIDLQLPTGTFHIDTAGLQFVNIEQFKLTGTGSDQTILVQENSDTAVLSIRYCREVTIGDLAINLSPIPILQGTITAINIINGIATYDFDVHAGYLQMTTDVMSKLHGSACFFSGTDQRLIKHNGWFGPVADQNVFRIDDQHGQLKLSPQNITIGDMIAIAVKGHGFPLNIKYSDTTRLEDVSLLASSSLGIAARFLTGDNYLQVNIKRAPMPAGATEVPLFSTNADGLQYFACPGSLTMDDCDFGFMGDDGVNISTPYLTVLEVVDASTIKVILSDATDLKAMVVMSRVNDVVRPLRYGTFNPLDEVVLASASYDDQLTSVLPSMITGHYQVINITPPATWYVATLTFTEPSVSEIQVGDFITLRRFFPSSYTIKNSHFHDTRARGLLLMAPDGLIDNNTIDYTYLPGILMGNEFPLGFADWVRDTVVSNNVVTNTMMFSGIGPNWNAVAAIQLGHSNYHRSMADAWGNGNRNVQIINNLIDTTEAGGILINGLVNGVVQGNTINKSHLTHGADAGINKNLTAPYAITIMNSTGIVTGGNLVTNPGPYYQDDFGDKGVYP